MLLIAWAAGAQSVSGDAPAPAGGSTDNTVEQGRYLATAGNCISCHTRKGGESFAGGVAFNTPFGTIYSTNITPDNVTGIGRWTQSDLAHAMRDGVAADGHRLFPAFPYTAFTKVGDRDVAAIYAFLRTLKPARYTPPSNGFLFDQRWGMTMWNASYFSPGRYVNDSGRSEEWNRGAYLTLGLGHCGACHTPRNLMQAEVPSRAFAGGIFQQKDEDDHVRRWSAVNLTSSSSGLGAWSIDDIVKYLSAGFTQRGGAFGPMNEVIVNSTRHLSADDLHAMAVYLKSLPAQEPGVEDSPSAHQIKAGESIYRDHCSECHLSTGRGNPLKGPRLAGSAVVQAEDPASVINVILFGADAPTASLGAFAGWESMKPYRDVLSDEETADLVSYLRNTWGNKGNRVRPRDVAQQR